MAALSYEGPDTESATALERDHLSAQLNAILAHFGTGYMLHVDAIRTPAVSYPHPDRSFFPDPVTRLMDDERRRYFQSAGTFFESRHILVLHGPPPCHPSGIRSLEAVRTPMIGADNVVNSPRLVAGTLINAVLSSALHLAAAGSLPCLRH